MLYTIQNSVFPKIGLCTEAELYFRLNEYVDLNIHDARFTLEPRGKIGADTYFNSISVGKLKRHTTIEDLQFAVRLAASKSAGNCTACISLPLFSMKPI